jgi:Arm DNA-binding domain
MRTIGKLTALAVQRASKRGMISDGAGLYLQIAEGGSKSWILRFKRGGRTRHFGIGPLHTVTLAEARQRAAEARLMLLDGKDPIEARRRSRAAAAKVMTFDEAAAQYIEAHAPGAADRLEQSRQSIADYASPVIGAMDVRSIDTPDVMRVLTAIWTAKPVTASRLRGRIESILDWAKVKGYRAGESNPASWRGNLDHLLPATKKLRAAVHHAAMPYVNAPAFMADLRQLSGARARCLETAILTGARTAEIIGMQLGGDRPCEKTVDSSGRAHEGPARASCPVAR